MEPVEFTECNRTYAKDQPQYRTLPCHAFAADPQGGIVFCWKLSWRERLRLLWGGRLWHTVLTFHTPLQPQLLELDKPGGMVPSKHPRLARQMRDDAKA